MIKNINTFALHQNEFCAPFEIFFAGCLSSWIILIYYVFALTINNCSRFIWISGFKSISFMTNSLQAGSSLFNYCWFSIKNLWVNKNHEFSINEVSSSRKWIISLAHFIGTSCSFDKLVSSFWIEKRNVCQAMESGFLVCCCEFGFLCPDKGENLCFIHIENSQIENVFILLYSP